MNELEATRAKLKCLEMVEGTGLNWWQVVRCMGCNTDIPWTFKYPASCYEFALAVIEGKPVWKGDELWSNKLNRIVVAQPMCTAYLEDCTWNPPTPKTIMVEMTLEDVKYLSNRYHAPDRIAKACQKALNNLETSK